MIACKCFIVSQYIFNLPLITSIHLTPNGTLCYVFALVCQEIRKFISVFPPKCEVESIATFEFKSRQYIYFSPESTYKFIFVVFLRTRLMQHSNWICNFLKARRRNRIYATIFIFYRIRMCCQYISRFGVTCIYRNQRRKSECTTQNRTIFRVGFNSCRFSS